MHETDFRRIDLNLLVALDALLEARSVTRAAVRIGRSQPAMSRALGRLRALFGDALLVEARTGYLLSARAEALRPALRRTLADIGAMLETGAFDPATATGDIRLMTPDITAAGLAPPILDRLALEAPALGLVIQPPAADIGDALERDLADATIGVFDAAPAGVMRRGLYEDRFVTLLRAGHPALAEALTLDRYCELGHIVISVTGVGPAPLDTALAAIGRARVVKARVPNFLAAIEIAARSDLAITLPETLARTAAGMGRFVALPPPVAVPGFTMSLLWHARRQDEPRHGWLRRIIVAAAADFVVEAGRV